MSSGALQFYRNPSVTITPVSILSSITSPDNFTIRSFIFINDNPYQVYAKFYDIASGSVTVGASTVIGVIPVPAGGFIGDNQTFKAKDGDGNETNEGGARYFNFTTAISMAITKNRADNDNTAPTLSVGVENLTFQKL